MCFMLYDSNYWNLFSGLDPRFIENDLKVPFISVVAVATLPPLASMILQMILAAVLTFNLYETVWKRQ